MFDAQRFWLAHLAKGYPKLVKRALVENRACQLYETAINFNFLVRIAQTVYRINTRSSILELYVEKTFFTNNEQPKTTNLDSIFKP
jgi:hypothetical protein